MFYIEKNDKPNFLQKKFCIIKLEDNKIFLPIIEENTNRQIEKMAQKTKKIINKYSNSKKIVLSKEIQKQNTYINYLNTYGFDISNGRWLYEILATDIIEYVINKKKLEVEKIGISVLINDLTDIELENIKILAKKYRNLNIVTNHIEKFKKIEEKFLNEDGIVITITNNKKKSLMKSKIILNVDFPKEILNKYMINDNAIIINIRGKMRINKKRFNGININNYEINFRDDNKDEICLNEKYYLKDIYESKLYKKQTFEALREKIKRDKVVIDKLFLNNSEL